MPRWDNNKFVCQSNLVNKTLQQVIDYETSNKGRKNRNFSRKVPEENVEAVQIISSSLKTLSIIR